MDVDVIQKVFSATLNKAQSLEERELSGLSGKLDWADCPSKPCTLRTSSRIPFCVSAENAGPFRFCNESELGDKWNRPIRLFHIMVESPFHLQSFEDFPFAPRRKPVKAPSADDRGSNARKCEVATGAKFGTRGDGAIQETTTLRNTQRSRWPQIANGFSLGSIAARQPSHFAFLWFLTMPPNKARSNIRAANPQAASAQHRRSRSSSVPSALLTVFPTNCKCNTVYCVLCTVYITSTTLRNT